MCLKPLQGAGPLLVRRYTGFLLERARFKIVSICDEVILASVHLAHLSLDPQQFHSLER